MIVNPFLLTGSLTAILEREDCQRIHYHALREAVQGIHPEVVPESLPLAALRARARLDGAEVYLFHPTDIDRLFPELTLPVYPPVPPLSRSHLVPPTNILRTD